MNNQEIYEKLLLEWEARLESNSLAIFRALRIAYPAALTRRNLILAVFGEVIPLDADLNNNKFDRIIRKTIKFMFEELGIPIVSSSAQAGYKLDITVESMEAYILQAAARESKARENKEAAYKILDKIKKQGRNAIPTDLPEFEKPVQLSLL